MKKITLLLFHSEKERFLKSLQQLGVVHIETTPEVTSVELERAVELESRYERAIKALKDIKLKDIKRSKTANLTDVKVSDPILILDEFDEALKGLKQRTGEIRELESVVKRLRPWGDFEPENIIRLDKAGVAARFLEVPQKQFRALKLDGLTCSVINRDKEKVYLVIFDKDEELKAKLSGMRLSDANLPSISLGNALNIIDNLKGQKMEIQSSLERLAPYVGILVHAKTRLEELIRFNEAMLHMKEERGGKVLSVKGWFRLDMENELRSFLDEYTSCYEIKDPEDGDSVPILLKNNRFSSLFEPITRIFSLPAYFELDPTPFFAPFFALFFGLCLADLGYGLIVFLATVILFFKGPARLKSLSALGMVLGATTIVGGLLLNSFLGHPIFSSPGVEDAYFPFGHGLAPLGAYVEDGQMLFPAMTFALVLGFGQVVFGMFLQAVNCMRRSGLPASIQPLSYILMMIGGLIVSAHSDAMGMTSLKVGSLMIGEWLLAASMLSGKTLLFCGLALLLTFNNLDKGLLLRLVLGIWEFYGFITGLMGDILSYLRLFALGLAGGLLGNAVNRIAFMIISDDAGVLHYSFFGMLGMTLVLVLGHSLNMAIAALGGFVHSLRLTFVEFYKNLRFEGGSKPFEPLSLQNRN
ncbi:MAG: V-type ATPase 116kDa subunit family protein [bacterium]|nr:V-type ATPase 116kDa subunit family protein [bacterium]